MGIFGRWLSVANWVLVLRRCAAFGQNMEEHHVLTDDKNSTLRRTMMKTGTMVATACLACAIVAAGYGQSGNLGEPAATSANPVAAKDATIKIKGLYIGMDIQVVPALLKEKLGDGWGILLLKRPHPRISNSSLLSDKVPMGGSVVTAEGFGSRSPVSVAAGPDGKVQWFYFPHSSLGPIFNAKGMEISDFAKQFANSYGIPEMKVSDDRRSWTYTSADGTRVEITSEGDITVEKVASAQERNQSFD